MARIPLNFNQKTFIYTLSDPYTKEVRYIGKTVKSLKSRLNNHLYTSKKVNNYRCNWIKSILNKGNVPIIEILDECQWKDSQHLECYWISQFKSWGFDLVNSTEGGEGNLGLKLNNERKQKLRQSRIKKIYQYDLQGNFIKSYNSITEAAKSTGQKGNSKISNVATGKRGQAGGFLWSYLKYKKLNPYKRNTPNISDSHKNILRKAKSKPILQFSLDNNFIKEWDSAKQAAKELNLCYISIINYLNNKKINHKNKKNKIGKFIWKRKIEVK